MSTHTHDNQCDTGQPCAMCLEVGEPVPDFAGIDYPCCPDCDFDTRDSGPTIPTFADAWQTAPRTMTRLVTVADAEYWWRKGEQAGRIAEQVETQRWLQQMVEGYSERTQR